MFAICIGLASNGRFNSNLRCEFYLRNNLCLTYLYNCTQMDRMVKIWRMPQIDHAKVKIDSEHLAREDKPLFSTDLIHNARVLSIAW